MTELGAFCDDSFGRLLALSPEAATELGVKQIGGHQMPQDGFSDITVAGEERRCALIAQTLEKLLSFPAQQPGSSDELNRRILDHFLRWGMLGRLCGTESHAFMNCDYVADHLQGVQTELVTCLSQWQSLDTGDAVEAFMSRVAAVPAQIDDLIEALRVRSRAGNIMPCCVVARAMTESKALLDARIEEHPICRRFKEHGPHGKQDRLIGLVEREVQPAYRRLQEYLSGDLAREERVGAWRLKDGDGYYAFLLKAYTTTDLSADAIHATGQEQLDALQRVMVGKLQAQGFVGATLGQQLAAFDARQQTSRPGERAERRQADLLMVNSTVRQIEAQLRPLFGLWPRAPLTVKPVPEAQESNRWSAYVPPAADGSRSGTFDINLSHSGGSDPLSLYTLVYHEAFPGHHVQFGIAQELGDALPAFRRTILHNAFIEGWAKYAELLPWMEGLNTDPLWEISRCRSELFSTVTMVLDTGIHHKRWTRQEALAFCVRSSGCDDGFAAAIVDRSIARPGSLCAYKIGMTAMLSARRRMQQALGERFEVRRFHDVVLGQGSVPLEVLGALVEDEIARTGPC